MQTKENEDAQHDGLTAADLEELLAAVPGVANIEVDLREDGSPHLRVWLDGSVPADDVGEEIQQAVSAVRIKTPTQGEASPERKVGLGKGLNEILESDEAMSPPHQFRPETTEPEPEVRPTLALVAVEETAGGISVRAADSKGGIAFSPVDDPRSLNQAVVSAVARLRQEKPIPRLAGVEIRDVSGDPVLTVVLVFADGRRSVGAALVEGGMPFTLGRAVWEAIGSFD